MICSGEAVVSPLVPTCAARPVGFMCREDTARTPEYIGTQDFTNSWSPHLHSREISGPLVWNSVPNRNVTVLLCPGGAQGWMIYRDRDRGRSRNRQTLGPTGTHGGFTAMTSLWTVTQSRRGNFRPRLGEFDERSMRTSGQGVVASSYNVTATS